VVAQIALLASNEGFEMTGEISYDLVMGDDMEFVEGTFRLPNGEWEVLIVKKRDTTDTIVAPYAWPSGVHGVVVHVPRSFRLNKRSVEGILAERLGVAQWNEVFGPDSLQIR
jgi:hypothetical protein